MTLHCLMIRGDCISVLDELSDASIDCVFCDLPYSSTRNKWDSPIDLRALWNQLKRVRSPKCAIAMTADIRFSFRLLESNTKEFKYDLIWRKSNTSGFLNAKVAPLRNHEMLLMFGQGKSTYNPQMIKTEKPAGKTVRKAQGNSTNWGKHGESGATWRETGYRYPRSCFDVLSEKRQLSLHPTQKPMELLQWVVKTYSNAGDCILDPTSGSGTTACAALLNGRNAVCIEKDDAYFDSSVERVRKLVAKHNIDAQVKIIR